MIRRIVQPELLDILAPDDPESKRSRRDLQRLNWWMRNESHLLSAIGCLAEPPSSILEIGSGDGVFMLSLARKLHARWNQPVRLFLLDMKPVISDATLKSFAAIGWEVQVLRTRLEEWLRAPSPENPGLVLGNLVFHHFQDRELREIFDAISRLARAVIACEPRRWLPSMIATRLIWAIGCNRVTQNDAIVSVRAGFRDRELTALWPSGAVMRLEEYSARFASHIFIAQRD